MKRGPQLERGGTTMPVRVTAPLCFLALLALSAPIRAADPPTLAAWPGVFPECTGYARSFEKPVLGEKSPPDRTKQTEQKAVYEWTGGSIRHLELTLGVSPKLQDAPKGAEKVTLGKTAAWYLGKMKD